LPRKQHFLSHKIHHLGNKPLHFLLGFEKTEVDQNHVKAILQSPIKKTISTENI
jgi:hypothetical protein